LKNICFIGAPGSGKTTQVNILQRNLENAPTYVGKVTNIINLDEEILHLLTKKEIELLESMKPKTKSARMSGNLASIIYDDILFKTTKRIPEETMVLFEGGPRSLEIARLFLKQEHLTEESIIFHFSFPENEYEYSLSRQVYRALINHDFDYVKKEIVRFKQKYDVYFNDTLKGLELLRNSGIPVYTINPHQNISVIEEKIKKEVSNHFKNKGVKEYESAFKGKN
jgi:adenylate kinase family enzyme